MRGTTVVRMEDVDGTTTVTEGVSDAPSDVVGAGTTVVNVELESETTTV